jgi:hypothetical protein
MSCLAWATTYYVKTSWEAREHGWLRDDPGLRRAEHQMSPAWVCRSLAGCAREKGGCDAEEILRLLAAEGVATTETMPWSDDSVEVDPDAIPDAARDEAVRFRNAAYACHEMRNGDFIRTALPGIRAYLRTTGPLVVVVRMDEAFKRFRGSVFRGPTGRGERHAMACVAYSESRSGGALLFANSWGEDWGHRGYAWIPYDVLQQMFVAAWSMEDLRDGRATAPLPPVACAVEDFEEPIDGPRPDGTFVVHGPVVPSVPSLVDAVTRPSYPAGWALIGTRREPAGIGGFRDVFVFHRAASGGRIELVVRRSRDPEAPVFREAKQIDVAALE